jgi:hypothetical protein
MMTMKNPMQFPRVPVAVMLCAALAAAPGLAQHAATDGSGRDASHVEGGVVGDGTATRSEAHFNGVDPGGDLSSANRSRAGDPSHIGVSAHGGSGIDARRARAAPPGAPGMVTPSADAGANTDLGPIRLEGFTGPQRRGSRIPLIANAPKISGKPSAAIGIGAPFMSSGANGGTARNAAGVVVPGAASSALGTPTVGRNAPDLRTSAAMSANAVGSLATTATGAGAAWRRPSLPSSAVTETPSRAGVISGTTVSHIASGPGYLGGPAKDRSGINGTAIRLKY